MFVQPLIPPDVEKTKDVKEAISTSQILYSYLRLLSVLNFWYKEETCDPRYVA